MDAHVLQNIDPSPSANNVRLIHTALGSQRPAAVPSHSPAKLTNPDKKVDSLIDKSPDCVQQLSPISFWDYLQALVDFNSTTPPSTTYASGQKGHRASSPSAEAKTDRSSGKALKALKPAKPSPKPPRKSERKRTKSSQAPDALDSSDYWLRFDSDDDSLDSASETESPAPSTKRRPFSIISPGPRTAFVGSPGSFKLGFQGLFDGPIDDGALVYTLLDEDDPLPLNRDDGFTKSPSQPQVVAPERLYSTTLSWEPPQPRLPMDSYFATTQPLSDPERQRLLAIAIGTSMAPGATRTPANLSMGFDFAIHRIPTTFTKTKSCETEQTRKGSQAKSSRSGQTSRTTPAQRPKENTRSRERAAHNDIERKYRTNLNDRMSELWEAIPSLRSIPEDGEDDSDSPVMQSRAPKGTVLTKATEYIHQLERRNRSIEQKNEELTRWLQAFEQLLSAAPAPRTRSPRATALLYSTTAHADSLHNGRFLREFTPLAFTNSTPKRLGNPFTATALFT